MWYLDNAPGSSPVLTESSTGKSFPVEGLHITLERTPYDGKPVRIPARLEVTCAVSGWVSSELFEQLRAGRARIRRRQRRTLLLWLCLRRYRRMVASN